VPSVSPAQLARAMQNVSVRHDTRLASPRKPFTAPPLKTASKKYIICNELH